jgi:hypothetical protein
MDWWLCRWRILETVTSYLETFSILKEKFFNPKYNTDIKPLHKTQWKFDGTPDTIYHLIISQWYLSQAFWEPDVQVCTVYTFDLK